MTDDHRINGLFCSCQWGNYSLHNNKHGEKVANPAIPFSPLHHKSVVTNISNYFSSLNIIVIVRLADYTL